MGNIKKSETLNNGKNLFGNVMSHGARFIIAFIVLFCLSGEIEVIAQMQVYPVSVSTQLTPPYSVNLADYAAPGCEQLKVIIVQRDLTQSPYSLYLKMEIALNGRVIIRSADQFIQSPLILDPGLPTVISGSDLYPFFEPGKMEFSGYSRETYIRTKSLPEGSYTITFTAYDYARREVALSSGGSMFCFLSKTEPPILNLPFNNTGVVATPSQNIIFQWLSRNTASPVSMLSTIYRFELFEMRLDGRRPDEIVQSSRPVFTYETDRTAFPYTISEPHLEKGIRYAWRVKASDTRGRDYIRNNGYSEVFSFVYGIEENDLPADIVNNFVAEALSPQKARLSWDPSTDFDSYKVFYRSKGSADQWFEDETVQTSYDLTGLVPGNIYECRVQGRKSSIWGGFSNTDTVLQPFSPIINCGSTLVKPVLTNIQPLMTLLRLQEIDAGGFFVTVVQAEGTNGRFSGRGYVRVPLFGNVKLRCDFSNILINNDYQLIEGVVRLITDNNEGGGNALWDLDNEFEGGADNGVVREGIEEVSVTITDVVIPGGESLILDTINHQLLIITTSGDTIRTDVSPAIIENSPTITVSDEEGNLYSIDTETGETSTVGRVPASGTPQQLILPSTINSDRGTVKFEAVPGETKYAFDVRNSDYAKSSLFMEEYRTIQKTDGSLYDVPFKLIPVGETDVIIADVNLKDHSLSADSIVFRSSAGTIYNSQPTGTRGKYLLKLPSGLEGDGLDIFALYPVGNRQFDILGKLTVLSYSIRRPEVILVPVNGNDIDESGVKEELDKIYKPVGVDWKVSKDENFIIEVENLDVSGSGLFSQYTDGMKKLNNAFIEHKGSDFSPSAVYLFILQWSDDPNSTGDMPRGKQFGYVFTDAADQFRAQVRARLLNRTIAHELGHGVFKLKHTFDNDYSINKFSTENLMDYSEGTDLIKHQWDAIHDPGIVIGVFERDEDAASIWNGSLNVLDSRHTLLFNHIYENNNASNLNYLQKIQYSRITNPEELSLDLDYDNIRENEWINSWNLRTKTSDEILENVIKKIQDADKDEKIPTISLNEKGIYIGKFTLNEVEYPIAVYSEKSRIDNISKVKVSEITDLDTDENKKRFKSEETFIKYLLLAFYEEGNTEPVLMMQIEKFDISLDQDTKEIWLRYLNILGTEKIAPLPGDPLINMEIVHNNSSPNSGGMFGCSRIGTGCDQSTIPLLPKYGNNKKVHDGIDLYASLNTDVYSMYDGIVVDVVNSVTPNMEGNMGAFGNKVIIKYTKSDHKLNSNIIYVLYGHLNGVDSNIQVGMSVSKGQKIGISGRTGNAFNIDDWRYHLHIAIYEGGRNSENKIDPRTYFTTKFDNNGNKME